MIEKTHGLEAPPWGRKARSGAAARSVGLEQLALAIWGSPSRAALLSAIVYASVVVVFNPTGLGQGLNPFFVYLADALLHGQLALVHVPPVSIDLIHYQDRYYLYWPPFPALLFVPLVAAFGLGVSDMLVALGVAALDVGLVSLLLRDLHERGIVDLPVSRRAWLTAFFAFGTVHLPLALRGHASYTAQIVAFAMLCGAYLAAVRLPGRRGAVLAGAMLGCALLSRTTIVLAGFWAIWHIAKAGGRTNRRSAAGLAAAGLAPVALALASLALYNYLRFGAPSEMGLAYLRMNPRIADDLVQHGAFSLHYLPANLYYHFVSVPYLALLGLRPEMEFWMGGSLFLMSPTFLLAVVGMIRHWDSDGRVLAVSCSAGLLPALLWLSSGWVEFGPRFTLDITVPLLIATALGASQVSTRFLSRLCVVSMLMYLPGSVMLARVL